MEFEWERALVVVDDRFDYGEERFIAKGHADDGRGYSIVFTLRGERYRIISVRRFTRQESKAHGY